MLDSKKILNDLKKHYETVIKFIYYEISLIKNDDIECKYLDGQIFAYKNVLADISSFLKDLEEENDKDN